MEMAMMIEFLIIEMGKIWPLIKYIFDLEWRYTKLKHKVRRQQVNTTFCFPDAQNWQKSASGCSCDFWQQLQWGSFGCEKKEKTCSDWVRPIARRRKHDRELWYSYIVSLPWTQSQAHLHVELSVAVHSFLQLHFSWLGFRRAAACTAADCLPAA